MFTLTFDNKLHLAPLIPGQVKRVLDAGTGTGIWAVDFGALPTRPFSSCYYSV